MNPSVTIHTIIKNEDQWIWYALMSVIDFADQILIYDTGSTDNTLDIIKSINSPKIVLESHLASTREDLVKLRQLQLDRTRTPWFMLLDGDEIWPQENLHQLFKAAAGANSPTLAFVTRTRNCIGDIYHYLPEAKGHYRIAGRTGHLNIRLIRKAPDLRVMGEYPLETYTLAGTPIQNLESRTQFVDTWYLHLTHLSRSTLRSSTSSVIDRLKKHKFRFGIKMTRAELPQVLWQSRPTLVPPPITNRWLELIKSIL